MKRRIAPGAMGGRRVARHLQYAIPSVHSKTIYAKSMAARGGMIEFENYSEPRRLELEYSREVYQL